MLQIKVSDFYYGFNVAINLALIKNSLRILLSWNRYSRRTLQIYLLVYMIEGEHAPLLIKVHFVTFLCYGLNTRYT